jgi:hypothetical protein
MTVLELVTALMERISQDPSVAKANVLLETTQDGYEHYFSIREVADSVDADDDFLIRAF